MRKFINRKTWPLIICFLAPIFIMACYFAYRNMSPFGNQSILTVDLGQQYIDLFAYFKHVLINHPDSIFYSFSKGLGGEMFGTWAYYLMSPVNLLLLIIPLAYLPAGVLILILIKYGLAGLSFGYLLTKTQKTHPTLIIMWSIIYALNGWIIANQINVMWLDGMVWLPIVVLGINQIFNQSFTKTYLIGITLAVITNYYMGYMITIFTILYIVFKFMTASQSFKNNLRIGKKLCLDSLTAIGLSAWLLLPTWYALTQGKAHYTRPRFNSRFEYFPFKMFSKLFNGSLNFSQLPSGMPNIFIGSAALIGALIYLFWRRVPIRKRLGALLMTLFLILSMCYQPLDLFWHAGQFPIWYPYRFSFIFCFWMIWLAANAIDQAYRLTWLSKTIISIIISLLIVYVFVQRIQFPFITPLHFIIGAVFLLITFILLIYTHNGSQIFVISLLALSTIEMSFNAYDSLNNINYVSNASYATYTKELSSTIHRLRQQSPYRIGKSFYRSKDDPFNADYAGGDVFDSSLEYTTPRFMKAIGQPSGQGFVLYSNGTLLSDRLLDYRYFFDLSPFKNHTQVKPVFQRSDVNNYPVVNHRNGLIIHRNHQTLPLIFSTYPSALRIRTTSNPVMNQNHWYQAITHQSSVKLRSVKALHPHRNNVTQSGKHLSINNPLNPGWVTLKLTPQRNQILYLLISPRVNPKTVSATINGHALLPKVTYNHAIILNLNSGQNKTPVDLKFRMLQNNLNVGHTALYQLNAKQAFSHPLHSNTKINHFSDDELTGSIKTSKGKPILGTSIPATQGWHLSISGKPTPIKLIDHEFIGASLKPGKHTFRLIFIPPFLIAGLSITLLTIVITIYIGLRKRKNKSA